MCLCVCIFVCIGMCRGRHAGKQQQGQRSRWRGRDRSAAVEGQGLAVLRRPWIDFFRTKFPPEPLLPYDRGGQASTGTRTRTVRGGWQWDGKEDVLKNVDYKKSQQEFSHIINKYTKLDPTLPRINNVLCPNADCATNKDDSPREIIYIRYDNQNMKYVYLCSTCDTVWKTEDQS